jgi:hypothetical protein
MTRRLILALGLIVVFLLLLYPFAHAQAQHDHAQHHAFYQGWYNKRDKGCCNDQDCGILNEENERETATGVEVRIEGKWCPVEPFHYLKKGNAPDWSTSHVCVRKPGYAEGPSDVCGRLLCYQPKPGI